MSYNSIFYFLTEKYSERRKYSTVVGFFCALKILILFAKDIQIKGVISDGFLKGIFLNDPPDRAKELLRWNLNDLLRFLESETFGPLEEKPFLRKYQKTLALILLATGRRNIDILILSSYIT